MTDPLPQIEDYIGGLKDLANSKAKWEQKLFTSAAILIICAHIFATFFALLALKLPGHTISWLLGAELVLLAIGFGVHSYLHATHRVHRWAMSRLAAEVARSVSSIGNYHIYLDYLFTLPFPAVMRPLLRTICVLQLRSTREWASEVWDAPNGQKGEGEKKRDKYVQDRLLSQEKGAQIPYNKVTLEKASTRFAIARYTFICASALAIVATFLKLLVVCDCITMGQEAHDTFKVVLGFFAILLPIIAVAALSLASAFDLEARHANSKEMLAFLLEQQTLLENASSTNEYNRLITETESRLLGETVNWYVRRTFLGV